MDGQRPASRGQNGSSHPLPGRFPFIKEDSLKGASLGDHTSASPTPPPCPHPLDHTLLEMELQVQEKQKFPA